MRAQFILELQEDLKKVQVVGVKDDEIRILIEDIRKFLREDLEDFENNQQVIGMKHLFREFSIKVWNGTDFSGDKHTAYNRIENEHCIKCYFKRWKDRNDKLHDEEVKLKRIT